MNYYLLTLISFTLSQSCWKYRCNSDTFPLDQTTCAIRDPQVQTYYLQPCPQPQHCYFSTSSDTSQCGDPVQPTQISYPGQSCQTNSDCGFGSCQNNICKGLQQNSSCSDHLQCDSNLRCSSDQCKALLKANQEGCLSDFDCPYSQGCSNGETTGVCVDYFSLDLNSTVTDCSKGEGKQSAGLSFLCESSKCLFTSFSGFEGVCSLAPNSGQSLPKTCVSNLDCRGSDGERVYTTDCECGYNQNGNAYCNVLSGDAPYLSFVEEMKTFVKSSDIQKCNTARRYSEGCWKEYGRDLYEKWLYYKFYPQLQGNDVCV